MKIGILTFHRAINYGAFLQAYALKSYLTSLSHEVEILDYWPINHELSYKADFSGGFIKAIKKGVAFFLSYNRKRKKENCFDIARLRCFGLGKNVKYRTLNSMDFARYDAVFYGSDQIWWKSTIKNYTGFDPVYWGFGLPNSNTKICYAPSMGVINLDESDYSFIQKALLNFKHISVRENQLKTVIDKIGGLNVPVVVDPTLLMSKEWWEKECRNIAHPQKYVLLFNLLKSDKAKELSQRISYLTKLPIVELTGAVLPLNKKNTIQTADPFQFLQLIKDASYVITSSFHGTVFSIIFQKEFYCTGFGEKGGRVKNLLGMLNLGNRYIEGELTQISQRINYSNISMDSYINESIEYIQSSLKYEK